MQVRDVNLVNGVLHIAFNYVVVGGQRVRKDTMTHQDRYLAMSGGLLNAVERLADPELDAAEHGFAWLGRPDAARLVAYVRDQIRFGALDDTDRADPLEEEADQRYADIIPTDETLDLAFRRRLAAEPSAFASAGD